MRRFSLILICLLILSACGKDSGEGSSPAGSPSDPGGSRNVTDCERAWQSMIDSYKVGTVRKYQTTTTSDVTPGPAAPHTTTHKETVTNVTPESIVYDVEYVPGGTSTVTLNRAEFLESCKAGVARTPTSRTEILEKRVEDVSVPAGTFNCDYVKAKVAATEGIETISETWTSKDGKSLLVKSTSQSTTPSGKTTSTTELVELTLP